MKKILSILLVVLGVAIATPTLAYTVQRGENLSVIARANNTTWQNLAQINNIKSPYLIRVGQNLIVDPTFNLGARTEESGWKQNSGSSVLDNNLSSAKPSTDLGADLGDENYRWNNLFLGGAFAIDSTATQTIYVSNTGTDSITCGSITDKCQTVTYALDKVGTFSGSNVTVQVSDGTYTVDNYTFALRLRTDRTGLADYSISIIGNTTTPANVIFQASTSTNDLFLANDPNLKLYVEGITITNGFRGFNFNHSNLFLKSVNISCLYSSLVVFENKSYGEYFDSSYGGSFDYSCSSSSFPSLLNISDSRFRYSEDRLTLSNTGGQAVFVSDNGRFDFTNNALIATVTGGASGGLRVFTVGGTTRGSNGLFLRGAWTISNFTRTSGSTTGVGIGVARDGIVSIVAGTTMSFSTTTNPVVLDEGAKLLSGNANSDTFTFNNTSTTLTMRPGSFIYENSTLTNTTTYSKNSFSGVDYIYSNDYWYGQLASTNTWSGQNKWPIRTATTSISVLTTDYAILCDATAGTVSFNFPSASLTTGQVFRLKKVDASANECIMTASSGNIDGVASKSISSQNDSVDLISDSSNYYIY
jgi:LysM repeat protein